MCYKTIDRILGVLFLIELCVSAFISIKIIQVWGGLSSLYSGLPFILFLLKISLSYIIGFFVVIFFFLNKPTIKWFLLFYVVLVLLINPFWVIKPNTPEYRAEIEKFENTPQKSDPTIPVKVTLRTYPFIYVKLFFVLSLLYVFTLRSKLEFKINNLEVKTS